MSDYGGEISKSYEEIRKLKGIGSYTAGAISSFAYGLPEPAVDGNILHQGSYGDFGRRFGYYETKDEKSYRRSA